MPSDHGFGPDDDQRIPPALPDTTEEHPDHAFTILQRRALLATAQHLELVTEGDVFEESVIRAGETVL